MNSYNDFAAVYDRLTVNVDYSQRAACYDFLIQANRKETGILLDLACGTGSMSFEFARMGMMSLVSMVQKKLSIAMNKKLIQIIIQLFFFASRCRSLTSMERLMLQSAHWIV